MCSPKSKRGLGLRSMEVMNKSLLCKWLWRFGREEDGVWRKVVASRHGALPNGDPCPSHESYGLSPWKGIMRLFGDFEGGLRIDLGNGAKTQFWKDRWCDENPLRRVYPSVFSLAVDPKALVQDYLDFVSNPPSWHPTLRRQVFDWEVQDIVTLIARLKSVVLNPEEEDRKVWAVSSDGRFNVQSRALLFGRHADILGPWKVIWYPLVPPKVQFFKWTASLGRIQTINLLRRKGLFLVNFCCLCKADGESSSHTLEHCSFAWKVWFGILRDFGMRWVVPTDLYSLLLSWKGKAFSARGNQI